MYPMAVARLRWAVNTSSWAPSEQEWITALSIIQVEEVKRVGQFVFQRDAKFALVGRLLIWAGLSEHMGDVSHLGYSLGRSERGKPLLLNEMGHQVNTVGFNISHQGDFVVLATERERAVGVDMMQLSEPRNTSLQEFFRIMRRQFTDKEWLQIAPPHVHTEKQQLSNFYRFWSLKESFIKAEGSGLGYGLQNLEFVSSSGWPPSNGSCCMGSRLFIRGEVAADWTFQESVLSEQHCVSVAVHGGSESSSPEPVPSFSLITVDWLLRKLQPSPLPLNNTFRTEWQQFKLKPANPG